MDWGRNPATIPMSWSCRGPGERKDLIFPSTSVCDSVNEDVPRVSGKQRISVVWRPEIFWHNFGVCTTRTDLDPFNISAVNGLGVNFRGRTRGKKVSSFQEIRCLVLESWPVPFWPPVFGSLRHYSGSLLNGRKIRQVCNLWTWNVLGLAVVWCFPTHSSPSLSPNLVSPKQRVSLGVFLPFNMDLGLLRSMPAGSAFIAVFLFWESRLIVGWNETATSFSLHPPWSTRM